MIYIRVLRQFKRDFLGEYGWGASAPLTVRISWLFSGAIPFLCEVLRDPWHYQLDDDL